MDDAEQNEAKELADMAIAFLKDLGIEDDAILATAVAYMIDDGIENVLDLSVEELKEYMERAAYNNDLAKKWLHAEKLTSH